MEQLRKTAVFTDMVSKPVTKKVGASDTRLLRLGAGDEARTRYLHLGKVALYQMSYTRIREDA